MLIKHEVFKMIWKQNIRTFYGKQSIRDLVYISRPWAPLVV